MGNPSYSAPESLPAVLSSAREDRIHGHLGTHRHVQALEPPGSRQPYRSYTGGTVRKTGSQPRSREIRQGAKLPVAAGGKHSAWRRRGWRLLVIWSLLW